MACKTKKRPILATYPAPQATLWDTHCLRGAQLARLMLFARSLFISLPNFTPRRARLWSDLRHFYSPLFSPKHFPVRQLYRPRSPTSRFLSRPYGPFGLQRATSRFLSRPHGPAKTNLLVFEDPLQCHYEERSDVCNLLLDGLSLEAGFHFLSGDLSISSDFSACARGDCDALRSQ